MEFALPPPTPSCATEHYLISRVNLNSLLPCYLFVINANIVICFSKQQKLILTHKVYNLDMWPLYNHVFNFRPQIQGAELCQQRGKKGARCQWNSSPSLQVTWLYGGRPKGTRFARCALGLREHDDHRGRIESLSRRGVNGEKRTKVELHFIS